MTKTRDLARIIRRQLADDPRLRAAVEKERLNTAIAALIYESRTQAGLTQKELADLVGTHQSVIARLEDADYRGHSLGMLGRIATALGRQLTVSLKPMSKLKAKTKQ
jgi:ribosome-binding protein aMBF1 (putative translation factor)